MFKNNDLEIKETLQIPHTSLNEGCNKISR